MLLIYFFWLAFNGCEDEQLNDMHLKVKSLFKLVQDLP